MVTRTLSKRSQSQLFRHSACSKGRQGKWGAMRLLAVLILFITTSSFATKMDEDTHSLVIDKLERALDASSPNAPERLGVVLRLADLYSDRARLKMMSEVQKNCDNCEGSKADRSRALEYYQQAFPKVKRTDQGKLLVQMAHLHNLSQEPDKAQSIYKDVIKKGNKVFSSEVVGAAEFNLGEIEFRKGAFKPALNHFDKAAKQKIPNRGFNEYRRAWCYFNLGQVQKGTDGLIRVLKNPEWSADNSFKEDVSHDLAIFFAHGTVTNTEIAQLRALSPARTKRANLFQLGTETDRLGKKSESLLVWAAYARDGESSGPEQIEIQIRVAQSEYDLGHFSLALGGYEKALNLWKANSCNEADRCDEIRKRMRGFVTTWNKALKVKPTLELLRAYQAYINVFPDDAEMIQWAALVAREVKQYKDAVSLFRRSALLSKNDKSKAKILEGSLLGEIEMAEKSDDLKLREDAYTFYLETNPQGNKAFEIRFSRANVWYKQEKYTQAYSEFHFVATTPGSENRELKVKAADLALDTLVLLKDDKSLEIRSNEYARLFPERKKEYAEISRKAALNQVASNLENKNAGTADFQANLLKLKTVNLTGASHDEKVKYWKNRLLVATQARNLPEVTAAADGLLSVAEKESDRNYALSQKEWAAELSLDFKTAYHLSLQIKSKERPADRDLRLALLADLAGLSPKSHYEDYLRHEPNLRSRNLTRVTLVKRSVRPWIQLRKHLFELKKNPDLLASLGLEIFGRERNVTEAQRLVQTSNISQYPDGRMLARHVSLGHFQEFKSKMARHRLVSSSDSLLQRSLRERLQLLAEADKRLNREIRNHDFTMEVLHLNLLATENRRLGQDLNRLPIPTGLNRNQRRQYEQLIQGQAHSYLETSAQIERRLQEKFNTKTFDEIERSYSQANYDVRSVLRSELRILAQNAPERDKNRLLSLANQKPDRPSRQDLEQARAEVKRDPFNAEKLSHLRELEADAGDSTMAAYLDARLVELKRKGRS